MRFLLARHPSGLGFSAQVLKKFRSCEVHVLEFGGLWASGLRFHCFGAWKLKGYRLRLGDLLCAYNFAEGLE